MQDADWSLHRGGSVQEYLVFGDCFGIGFNLEGIEPAILVKILQDFVSYFKAGWGRGKSWKGPSLWTFPGLQR